MVGRGLPSGDPGIGGSRCLRDLEIWRTEDPEAVRAILSVIAIAKGLRTHGRFLVEYSEDELLDIESRL